MSKAKAAILAEVGGMTPAQVEAVLKDLLSGVLVKGALRARGIQVVGLRVDAVPEAPRG